jgi:hypothetical protein
VQRLRDDEGNYYMGYPEVEIGRFDELATDIENSGAATDDPTRRLLRFQNGRGLRTVGYLPVVSGLVPLADEQIFYLFEGLTDDGRYYIWLQFNLHTTLLPDSASQFSAAQQTAFAAGSADYQAYLQAEMARVQALPATAFTPDLNLLDELLQSLDVPATASTTSSLPPNEPNCTNVATYIADITIPRDLDVPANATFNKTWRVQNMGTCTWSAAYQLRTQTGILLPVQDPVVPFTLPGDIVDISVTYYAPSDPGTYQETWQLNPPFSYEQPAAEPFGPNLPVVVTVSNPSP